MNEQINMFAEDVKITESQKNVLTQINESDYSVETLTKFKGNGRQIYTTFCTYDENYKLLEIHTIKIGSGGKITFLYVYDKYLSLNPEGIAKLVSHNIGFSNHHLDL